MRLTKDGYDFVFESSACESCGGKCCIGESGYIWVNVGEIEAIADFLNLKSDEFRDKFLFKDGYHYSINECNFEGGMACVFFDKEKRCCSIYEVRPTQCRTFPFWNHFKTNIEELEAECVGVKRL